MQTFLPFPGFVATAQVLDYRRLGKQRVEAKQIIAIVELLKSAADARIAWRNHPAVKMWAGYEDGLKLYANACIAEWVRRGYRNTLPLYNVQVRNGARIEFPMAPVSPACARKVLQLVRNHQGAIALPWWWNRVEFHVSHQSRLIAKQPEFYSARFPGVPDHLEYWWPSLQRTSRGPLYRAASARKYIQRICSNP